MLARMVFIVLALITLSGAGCDGGSDGSSGKQGEAGVAGDAGEAGTDGLDGRPGTSGKSALFNYNYAHLTGEAMEPGSYALLQDIGDDMSGTLTWEDLTRQVAIDEEPLGVVSGLLINDIDGDGFDRTTYLDQIEVGHVVTLWISQRKWVDYRIRSVERFNNGLFPLALDGDLRGGPPGLLGRHRFGLAYAGSDEIDGDEDLSPDAGSVVQFQWSRAQDGAQGLAGADGADGAQGIQGETGAPGADGSDGAPGAQGLPGMIGATGTDGSDGATGSAGAAGSDGAQGPQGVAGSDGAQGVTGSTGATGAQGEQGIQGFLGAIGEMGEQGLQGLEGLVGAIGEMGAQGIDGIMGAAGLDGEDGAQGEQGIQGDVGGPGFNGPTGDTGPTGPQGPTGADGVDGTDHDPLQVTALWAKSSEHEGAINALGYVAYRIPVEEKEFGLPYSIRQLIMRADEDEFFISGAVTDTYAGDGTTFKIFIALRNRELNPAYEHAANGAWGVMLQLRGQDVSGQSSFEAGEQADMHQWLRNDGHDLSQTGGPMSQEPEIDMEFGTFGSHPREWFQITIQASWLIEQFESVYLGEDMREDDRLGVWGFYDNHGSPLSNGVLDPVSFPAAVPVGSSTIDEQGDFSAYHSIDVLPDQP